MLGTWTIGVVRGVSELRMLESLDRTSAVFADKNWVKRSQAQRIEQADVFTNVADDAASFRVQATFKTIGAKRQTLARVRGYGSGKSLINALARALRAACLRASC